MLLLRQKVAVKNMIGLLCWLSLMQTVQSEATPAKTVSLPAEYAQSPSGKPLTEEQRAAIEHGEILVQLTIVQGTPVKRARAIALVDAPPEQVFAILTGYNEFPQFMPYCKKVEVQKKEGEPLRVRFELDFPWPIGDRRYVLRLTDRREDVAGKQVFISSWTYEPNSGNIHDAYGSWEVLSYDEVHSFVRYTVFTDPGGNIPNWANNMATEVAVHKVINGLRKRLNEKKETH